MLAFVIPIVVILLFLLVVGLYRRRKAQPRLGLRDIATIVDRSIAAYRRHLVPALALSTLCFFLGSSSGYNVALLRTLTLGFAAPEAQASLPSLLTNLWTLLNFLGIGSTVLAVGIATGLYEAGNQGISVPVAAFLPLRRPWALLGLILLMSITSIVSTFLGIIGMLLAVFWSLAPVVMQFEGLSPWRAVRRSYALVRANYSALLNTLVPLWLIGWLIAGLPIFGSIWLLNVLGVVPGAQAAPLATLGLALGQIMVAPLTAFGAVCLYQYLQAPIDAAAALEAAMAAQGLGQSE
jgi:hypothetical protein